MSKLTPLILAIGYDLDAERQPFPDLWWDRTHRSYGPEDAGQSPAFTGISSLKRMRAITQLLPQNTNW